MGKNQFYQSWKTNIKIADDFYFHNLMIALPVNDTDYATQKSTFQQTVKTKCASINQTDEG